jgi:hypothetical protein
VRLSLRALAAGLSVALGCNVYDPTLNDAPPEDDAGGDTGGQVFTTGWMLDAKPTTATSGSGGRTGASTATSGVTAGPGGAAGTDADGSDAGGRGDAAGIGGQGGTGGASSTGGNAGSGGASGSGMAGGVPDAGVDAGSTACPTGVLLTGENLTAMHGGTDPGDMLFKDVCPQGGPVIGYTGSIDTRSPASVGRIATVCGKILVTSTMNGCQVRVGAGSTLPTRGQYGDSPFTQMCPTNQVVVGMRGKSGGLLDQVAFVCAPLIISSGPTGYTLSTGSTTVLTPAGGNGGTAYQDSCAAGQIARGSNVTIIQGIVDAMGLVCGTFSLTGP